MEDIFKKIIQSIAFEEKAQEQKYSLNGQQSLRDLKQAGLVLHPIKVVQKSFGYADYPELKFQVPFMSEQRMFKDGVAVEIGISGQEPVKALLLQLEGNKGELRMFAPDFPDWIEENGVFIKLSPDSHTLQIMRNAIRNIENDKRLLQLFNTIELGQQEKLWTVNIPIVEAKIKFTKNLNESQLKAVKHIVENENICIVHGPPGTGKTTTLVQAVLQLISNGEKVCIAAPSNTAVDHFAKQLINAQAKILRVGNTTKVDQLVFAHTIEGRASTNVKQLKELKLWKQKAESFRKMALQYKRSFGKSEREQRNLLFKEVKSIRTEIKKIQDYNENKLFDEAAVFLGTPVALNDVKGKLKNINTLIIDEAGQCIAPLAWCIFPLADKIVLAGDHLQLPPVVLSDQAASLGLHISILEKAIKHITTVHLLNVQYRMRKVIAGFSSDYFYEAALQTPDNLQNNANHLLFIDTAGSGMEESIGAEGSSIQNEGEIKLVQKLIEDNFINIANTTFISPYNGQVNLAKQVLPSSLRCSTIDSFQGQEQHTIVLSLVRSNDNNVIGFLKDYRRMNVAITRAKEQLIIIGDSATIANDSFFNLLLEYIERNGVYKSVWEYEINF